jgi:uncharacterized Zn finger protein (UPF0148 family)
MTEPDEGPAGPAGAERRHESLRVLRTGTYLHTSCPVCGGNLIQGDWIVLDIRIGEQTGQLRLSPRFNVFDKEWTIPLADGAVLDDMSCPRCRASLVNPRVDCGRCASKTVRIKISAANLDVHLNVCVRNGCFWHGLSRKDRARLILEE